MVSSVVAVYMRVFVYVIIILISSRPWPAQSGQVETTELRQCNYNMLVCAGTRAGLLHCCTSTETVHTTLHTGNPGIRKSKKIISLNIAILVEGSVWKDPSSKI